MKKKGVIFAFILIVFTFALGFDFASAATRNCNSCSNCTVESGLAVSGDTILLANPINAPSGTCVYLNQNVTFDCQNFSNSVTGSGTFSFGEWGFGSTFGMKNVTIRNCNISGFTRGVDLQLGGNNTIANITMSTNYLGVYVESTSNNNTITNITAFNITSSSQGVAVEIIGSNNTISNITVYNNRWGIAIGGSGNVLRSSNMSNNTYNFQVFGGLNNTIELSNIVDYSYKIYYNYSISNFIYNPATVPSAGTIICINCNNITVMDLNLSHRMLSGITFYNTSNSIIQNITASGGNYRGIDIYGLNNTVTNITARYNGYGLYLQSASNNTLNNITATSNLYGVYIETSSNNILKNSNMSNNSYNFYIIGYGNSQFNHSIGLSNIIDYSYKIYYNYSASNYVYNPITSPNAGLIMCAACNNITIRDFNLGHNNPAGELSLFNTTNSLIQNITMISNNTGIRLYYCSDNFLADITTNNRPGGNGIYLQYSSNNTLTNIISKNNSYGIYFSQSTNNTIMNSLFENNTGSGIIFDYSNFNNATNITARNNSNGVYFFLSLNNTLTRSYLINNTDGVENYLSEDNLVYNNYLKNIKNHNNATDSLSNFFNITQTCGTNIIGGPYIGGNYWAYANGTGFSQNCADLNSDGICDSSLSLDTVSYDYLPLISTAGAVCSVEAGNGTDNDNGGSSGIIGTTETVLNKTITQLSPDNPTTILVNNKQLDLTKIIIDVSEVVSGASFLVTKVDISSEDYSGIGLPTENSYQAFKVDASGITNDKIANITFEFKVNKTWILDREGKKEDISLYRKQDLSSPLDSLPTTFVKEDSNYYYFSAMSHGFSTFIVFFGKYECQPGAKRCFDEQTQVCLGNATWLITEKCKFGCENGSCIRTAPQSIIIYTITIAVVSVGILVTSYLLFRKVKKKK